jgi:hypothetical protein
LHSYLTWSCRKEIWLRSCKLTAWKLLRLNKLRKTNFLGKLLLSSSKLSIPAIYISSWVIVIKSEGSLKRVLWKTQISSFIKTAISKWITALPTYLVPKW